MKTAKDLELSILIKESHIQQLNLKIHELEAEIERLNNLIKDNASTKALVVEINKSQKIQQRIIKALKFIQDNYSDPDGWIWHEDIRLIMEILEGDNNGKN